MPKYYIEEKEEYMFKDHNSEKEHLYYIISEIGVSEDFIIRHVEEIDEASKKEKDYRRSLAMKKANEMEKRGQKSNIHDLYEYYNCFNVNLWALMCQNQKLSEAFIEKYVDKLGWTDITRYQKLSEDFMRKHADYLEWWSVAAFQKFSEKFYLEFFDKIQSKIKYSEMITTREEFRQENLKNPDFIVFLKLNGYIN
jgi:hypothetical protein